MASTRTIFENLIAQLTNAVGASYNAVLRFDGSPFDAVEQAKLQRADMAAVLLVGLAADQTGLRGGSLQRINSTLAIDLIVLVALGSRVAYEAAIYDLDDLSDAVATAAEASGLASEIGAMGVQVDGVQVLVDPTGNFAARTIRITVSTQRTQ